MKERPILFSAPMVRALLAGTKTQTRRVMRDQPSRQPEVWQGSLNRAMTKPVMAAAWDADDGSHQCLCPYGVPGDRLWVRETWQHSNHPYGPADEDCDIFYRADYWDDPHGMDGEKSPEGKYREWRPSIHMPRWASRILLEIVGVRVERLQDISDTDAIAEGIERNPEYPTLWKSRRLHGDQNTMKSTGFPRLAYRSIWEQISGHESWSANPWVWVVEFKRVQP